MKMISMNEFQNAYSMLLQEVITLRESIVITKQEQPVVRISPYYPEPGENDNPLKNSIVFEKDIVAPIDEVWGVNP
jgi:antitoxin (DNA-binding transcriptional repressor) of toxin-antitoxin stability system